MRNKIILLLAAAALAASCEKDPVEKEPELRNESISMEAGYASEVFFSLENGVVKTSPRADWDIAFSTNPMSSTILLNEGLGEELYTWPGGDKDNWDAVDTAGIAGWKAMFNSDTSWYYGAFDRHDLGHPDYGWGVYNMQNHDVMGDSIFILRLADGSVKKLFIEKRAAMSNSFSIRYGDLGSEGVSKDIPCSDYTTRNFIYFSFASGEVVDVEPESDQWELLFTRYHDESIPYIVTGVLTNMEVEVAEVRDIDPGLADPSTAEFSEHISVIGSDWKSFNMGTFSYDITEDLCYFVRRSGGDTYKIVFTATDGSASGSADFSIEKLAD